MSHATSEASVSPTEAALMSTPVHTMPSIGDLFLSSVDKAEAFVSPAEAPVSPADAYGYPTSLAMVSIHPVGVDVVLVKEVESVKIASAKGLLRRGFLGSTNASSSSLPGMKEAPLSAKGSKVVVEDSQVCFSSKKSVTELGLRLSEPFPRMSESGAPSYSYVSKSQIGYA